MKNSFIAAEGFAENKIVIEKSQFFGFSQYVESEKDAQEFIAKVKKIRTGATHYCYAYITERGGAVKSSDDGEPSGTAGQPILEVIRQKKMLNTAVCVARCFGGIKLGAGGLVRAYTDAAAKVLEKTALSEYIYSTFFEIECGYDIYQNLNAYILANQGQNVGVDFGILVTVTVAVPMIHIEKWAENLLNFMQGKVEIRKIKTDYYKMIIDKR